MLGRVAIGSKRRDFWWFERFDINVFPAFWLTSLVPRYSGLIVIDDCLIDGLRRLSRERLKCAPPPSEGGNGAS